MDSTRALRHLPSISEKGVVYVITDAFPPVSAGSSVLNSNLFSRFSASSYRVFSTKTRFKKQLDQPSDVQLEYVATSFEHFSSKVHGLLLPLQLNYAKRKIIWRAREDEPVAVIATYPSLYFLRLGYEVARELCIPFFPYLHDTIVEALDGTSLQKAAIELQGKIWRDATKIFVMSEGMRRLYEEKYNIETVPLVHTYLGDIQTTDGADICTKRQLRAFWAGDIYGINHKALARIVAALNRLGHIVEFATPRSKEGLEAAGIPTAQNEVTFYAKRDDYLRAIQTADVLILALNQPWESVVHFDEISTIFPTKTPEYLSNGKLIMVHAPKQYFLSQFFTENKCGALIHETSIEALVEEIRCILQSPRRCLEYITGASRVASMFQGDLVRRRLSEAMAAVL